MKRRLTLLAALALLVPLLVTAPAYAAGPASVIDRFGRTVNTYGVQLVDWQGYLANPYVELTVRPPVDGPFPVTIDLKADGTSRLMMDLPSQLTATGATKSLTFANANEQKTFKLAIHSKRGPGQDELYTLRLTVRAANNTTYTQTMPIRVQQDEKTAIEPTVPITFDYRYDNITGYFNNAAFRTAAEEAVKDWFRFFDLQPFDTVAAGAETNRLPGNDWQNTISVTNQSAYNGMYVFFRGIQTPYSTGFPAANGRYHTRNGQQVAGPLHRSTSMIFEYDEAGKQLFTSLADEDWYKTTIAGSVLDVHGLVMHEYGHALAYHSDWAGMRSFVNSAGANDPEVTAYQGRTVPLDSSYHVPGNQPYWDRISGQSGGWTHLFPTRRWMLTKLALLVAENAGWTLNRNLTPFLAPSIVTTSLPNVPTGQAYQQRLTAKGGVPFYDWRVTSGSLPAGLTLDRFTGVISGTPTTAGTSSFTVELRDYDAASTPVTRTFQLTVGGGGTGGNVAGSATASCSFTSSWESCAAINDGIDPTSSNDTVNRRWGTWPNNGQQWAELQWSSTQSLNRAQVYLFDDEQGIDVPSSWKLQYWNGSTYMDVPGASGYTLNKNAYNSVNFTTVSTNRLRVVLQSNGTNSVGLLEVKVYTP